MPPPLCNKSPSSNSPEPSLVRSRDPRSPQCYKRGGAHADDNEGGGDERPKKTRKGPASSGSDGGSARSPRADAGASKRPKIPASRAEALEALSGRKLLKELGRCRECARVPHEGQTLADHKTCKGNNNRAETVTAIRKDISKRLDPNKFA